MNNAIIKAIQSINSQRGDDPVYLYDGEIVSVDKNKRTCVVRVTSGNTANELTARLMASVDDGFLCIPTVDSTVVIICSKQVSPLVILFSEIDEVVIRGGDKKGLAVLDSLVDRFNNIEQDINNLKTVFSSWSPIPNDGGAALKTAAATWISQTLTETQDTDIRNTKITQG